MENIKSVSILTITQYSRLHLFDNLINMVNSQTYTNIIEWVIVEGSKNKRDAQLNKQNIFSNIHKSKISIKYVEYAQTVFAEKFNAGNNATCGEIIVVMEDDDFYPSTRVSHAVSKLVNQTDVDLILIAGCSPVFTFDLKTNEFGQFKIILPTHSLNNSFAYYREYLLNNNFYGSSYSIEPTFTNNYKNKMIQLDPCLTIIHTFHDFNTINKYQYMETWQSGGMLTKIEHFPLDEKEKYNFYLLVDTINAQTEINVVSKNLKYK